MFFILLVYVISIRMEISSIRKQLRYLKENETNKILSVSHTYFLEINRFIWEMNELLMEDRKRLAAMQKQEKQLKSTLTNLTHDIRTPLTSLSGYFQLMEKEENEEDRLRYQNIISGRIRSLEEILEQLFLYVRLNEEHAEPALERVNLNQTLCEVLFSFYEDLKKAGIEPEVLMPEEICYIEASPTYLKWVLQNMMKNALDHGKCHIRIAMCVEGDEVEIQIENGLCSGEEDMDVSRVFDRFYKADAARQKTSTGLGLCIAKELVERMHGRVTAEKNDGTFLLSLYFHREMP